jgi:hypothetical protein
MRTWRPTFTKAMRRSKISRRTNRVEVPSRPAASSTVNSLFNTPSCSCYAAIMVIVRSSSLAIRRSSRARAAAEAASHASPVD